MKIFKVAFAACLLTGLHVQAVVSGSEVMSAQDNPENKAIIKAIGTRFDEQAAIKQPAPIKTTIGRIGVAVNPVTPKGHGPVVTPQRCSSLACPSGSRRIKVSGMGGKSQCKCIPVIETTIPKQPLTKETHLPQVLPE